MSTLTRLLNPMRRPSLSDSRAYTTGFEKGFEAGTRAGVARDRLWFFAAGLVAGGALAFARYFYP